VLHILRNLQSATASSVWFLQGPKGWQSEGAKWRLGRTFYPAVWRYHAGSGLDSSFCLVELLQFFVINSCNVRTCRCAVTVAPLFKNYISRTPALSHKTPAIALTALLNLFSLICPTVSILHRPTAIFLAPQGRTPKTSFGGWRWAEIQREWRTPTLQLIVLSIQRLTKGGKSVL